MSFTTDGFELLENFLNADEVRVITEELEAHLSSKPAAGIRHADKKFPSINTLAHSAKLLQTAATYLPATPQLVRAILFDKTATNNWLVTWHQDKTICVSEKKVIADWGPWTLKEGMHHVQPSLDVLRQMVTLRIHLDAATKENGCLQVIAGSHQQGILSSDQIQQVVPSREKMACIGSAGSALVMRPLLLHASSKASHPGLRRVVHIEYSSYILPYPLQYQ